MTRRVFVLFVFLLSLAVQPLPAAKEGAGSDAGSGQPAEQQPAETGQPDSGKKPAKGTDKDKDKEPECD